MRYQLFIEQPKRLFITIVFISTFMLVNAQINIGVKYNSIRLTQKSSNFQVSKTSGVTTYFNHSFTLHKNLTLQVGSDFNINKITLNAIFKSINGTKQLIENDATITKSSLEMMTIKAPINLNLLLVESPKGGTLNFLFGPYLDYLLLVKQKYDTPTKYVEENVKDLYKVNYGITSELSFALPIKADKKITFGTGFSYQVSNYLPNYKSFKPFTSYIKIGFIVDTQKETE